MPLMEALGGDLDQNDDDTDHLQHVGYTRENGQGLEVADHGAEDKQWQQNGNKNQEAHVEATRNEYLQQSKMRKPVYVSLFLQPGRQVLARYPAQLPVNEQHSSIFRLSEGCILGTTTLIADAH